MRESAAFALCELLSTLPECIVNDIFGSERKESNGNNYLRVQEFVFQNQDGHPEKLAIRLHVAKLLSNSSDLLNSITSSELDEMCMIGSHSYPRVHLIFEKLLDIIPQLNGDIETFAGEVFTNLAESTVERKATALLIYQRLLQISFKLSGNDGFQKYEPYLRNKNVLAVLFSNNEKHTLCKLSMKIRSEMFDSIKKIEHQARYASIFYDYMPANLFIKLFYSQMNEENKVDFVNDTAKLKDLHSFAKSDKSEIVIKPLLKRLVDSSKNDEELVNRLFSCANDLLANPNTVDTFFPILNSVVFPKSKKKKFDNNEEKLQFILKFYNKFGDVEFEEDMDFGNLSETAQNFAALLNHDGENTKLLRHFVRLNWTVSMLYFLSFCLCTIFNIYPQTYRT